MEESKKDGLQLVLCKPCFAQQKFPNVYVASDFKLEHLSPSEPSTDEWPPEKQLEFLLALKEINCSVSRLGELEEKFGNPKDLLKRFLAFPLSNFASIFRVSNSSMENLFKRREKPEAPEDPSESPIFEDLAFIKLILDLKNKHKTSPEAESQTSKQLGELAGQNTETIERIENQLKSQANVSARRAGQKTLSEFQQANFFFMQKLETKLAMIEEYEKLLMHEEAVMMIRQNQAMVNLFLQKGSA